MCGFGWPCTFANIKPITIMNNNLFLNTMVGHISAIHEDCENMMDIINHCRICNFEMNPVVFQEFSDLITEISLRMGEIARQKKE